MITVMNKRTYKGEGVYIGRPTILGNPFTHIKQGTLAKYVCASREEAIAKHKQYLKDEWKKGGAIKNELLKLAKQYKETGEMKLICWCAPLPCHGDYLADVIKWAAEKI